MKYIRTKDGRIIDTTEYIKIVETQYTFKFVPKGYEYYKPVCTNIHKDEIIKQADTIEELCDEFVYQIGEYHYYNDDLEIAKGLTDDISKIYGAIWTNKGLIYVAKLNDKGELELL